MKYFKLVALFALLFIFSIGTALAYAQSRVVVTDISGNPEYSKKGSSVWTKLEPGAYLYSGYGVKTGASSSVEIAFDEDRGNFVKIEPYTNVILKLENPEKIELIDGEVLALIKSLPKGSSFEIRTPTAVCGARGTGWGAKGNKNETTVSGYENTSYVKGLNKDGSSTKDEDPVNKGFKRNVKKFEKPSGPMKLGSKDYESWNKWKKEIKQKSKNKRRKMEKLSKDLDKIQDQKERIADRKDDERMRRREESSGAGMGDRENGTSVYSE